MKPINEEITLKAHWEILESDNAVSENNTDMEENTNNIASIDNSQCKYTKKLMNMMELHLGNSDLGKKLYLHHTGDFGIIQ